MAVGKAGVEVLFILYYGKSWLLTKAALAFELFG
jgi:hypothetical protein